MKRLALITMMFMIYVAANVASAQTANQPSKQECVLYANTIQKTIRLHEQRVSFDKAYDRLLPAQSKPKDVIFNIALPMAIYQKLETMAKSRENNIHQRLQRHLVPAARSDCSVYQDAIVEMSTGLCEAALPIIEFGFTLKEAKEVDNFEEAEESFEMLLTLIDFSHSANIYNSMIYPQFAAEQFKNIHKQEAQFAFDNADKFTLEELKSNYLQRCLWP